MESLARTANRGSVSTGYDVSNSLLLDNSDSSMEFNHQQMSPGGDDQWTAQSNAGTNSKKATISLWIKRAKLSPSSGAGQYARLFQFQTGGNATSLYFVTDQLKMYDDVTSASLQTNRKFRDTSAWYHIVLAMDSTQSTAANRVKLYVNGVQETSWATEDYGNQNSDLAMFSTTNVTFYLGCAAGNGQGYSFDGYITEFNFVDGAQKAASDFGEYDEDSGIWKPKQYTGSYGTLGCYYNFEDTSSNRFNDESGNGNYMDNRGGSFEGKITTDTPTNNYATWNALFHAPDGSSGYPGGLKITQGATEAAGISGWDTALSTIAVSQGKWYAEFYITGSGTPVYTMIGAAQAERYDLVIASGGVYVGHSGSSGYSVSLYGQNGNVYPAQDDGNNDSVFNAGAIISVALDMDNHKIYWRENGTWLLSDDPASNNGYAIPWTGDTYFGVSQYDADNSIQANFGGYHANTVSSGNTDADGYGNFEYSVPSGYYALNTKNLAEYG